MSSLPYQKVSAQFEMVIITRWTNKNSLILTPYFNGIMGRGAQKATPPQQNVDKNLKNKHD